MKDRVKGNITITTTTGITDDFSNVSFVVSKDGFIVISLSNGKTIMYPIVNVARIIVSPSQSEHSV